MGARDVHVLGWAKSYVLDLSNTERVAQDTDIIGALSLFWALANAFMPVEVLQPLHDRLDQGYARLASRNIPPGKTFSISVEIY